MKNKLIAASIGLVASCIGFFAVSGTALAIQPTLVLTNQNNNSVLISTYGDPNSAVTLYHANSGSNSNYTSAGSIGWTNQSGTFSTTLNYNSYNIASGAAVYVVVNGQQSPIAYWPTNSNCYNYQYNYNYNNCNGNNGAITLSQTNLTLYQGQTNTVTIYTNSYNNNYYNTSYYVSNTNASYIADVTISGNQITVRANNPGTVSFTICGYNASGCATLYVTVQQNYSQYPNNQYPQYPYNNQYGYQYVYLNPIGGGYGNNSLIFQPSTVTVARKQSQSFNMSGMQGYGYQYGSYGNTYRIIGTTDQKIATVTISNNILYIQGVKKGTTTATICRNDNYCGTITITVSN